MSGVGSDHYGDDFGPGFQEHILAVIARVPSFALRYRTVLHPDFFVSKDHRLLARVLLDHIDEFSGLPTEVTLVEDIRERASKGELDALASLVGRLYAQEIGDADAVMSKVISFGQNQAMVNAVISGAEKLEKGDRDIRPLIDDALLVGVDLLDIGHDYAGDVESRLSWYLNPEEQVRRLVPTGITHMDTAMGGGLGRGEMGVVLAPPKRGKTTLLINIGFGAMMDPRGLTVVHFTFEMSRDKVARRYDDRLMGKEVRSRSSDPGRYTELLRERVETLVRGRLFIKEYPTRTATVSDMRSYLSILRAQGVVPDIVIVDYADIVKAGRRIGEMRHEQAGIYEDLRALSGEFDIALWAGSQSNRGSLDKEVITIQDFAEAFEKAAIVDAAWAFCQTLDEKVDHECRLFGAALRGHEDGLTAVCHIDREACLIESRELLDAAYAKVDRDPARATDEAPPAIRDGKADSALKEKMGLTTPGKKRRKRKKDSSSPGNPPKRSGPSRIIEWEDDES
jgi:replicative DNA helicase